MFYIFFSIIIKLLNTSVLSSKTNMFLVFSRYNDFQFFSTVNTVVDTSTLYGWFSRGKTRSRESWNRRNFRNCICLLRVLFKHGPECGSLCGDSTKTSSSSSSPPPVALFAIYTIPKIDVGKAMAAIRSRSVSADEVSTSLGLSEATVRCAWLGNGFVCSSDQKNCIRKRGSTIYETRERKENRGSGANVFVENTFYTDMMITKIRRPEIVNTSGKFYEKK